WTAAFTPAADIRPRASVLGGPRSGRLQGGLPLAVLRRGAEEDLRRHRPLRSERSSLEPHVRLLGRAPALAEVAEPACGHEVLPRVVAATRSRLDVIDVELTQRRLLSAILALVGVAEHQVPSR